jgi:hypothetical protein
MQMHNNFSCAWLETVSSAFSIAARQLGIENDFVAFARSGCISAAKHSRLFWAGDQLTSWDSRDGIGSALTAVRLSTLFSPPMHIWSPYTCSHTAHLCLLQLLTGGFFGRPVSHSDIGGYTNVFHPSNSSLNYNRSKVLFISRLLSSYHHLVVCSIVYSSLLQTFRCRNCFCVGASLQPSLLCFGRILVHIQT